MYPASFRWHRASGFKEASEALLALGSDAKLIAGGQTLIPMMKLRLLKPTDLIDISRVASGRDIQLTDGHLCIGALASHHAIGASHVVSNFSLIRDCALGIADPQVRNFGTIGGGLAEADPSGCWPTLLIALDAKVVCSGTKGERLLAVRELLVDAYSPALDPGEIITQIRIPEKNLSPASAYVAFKRSAPAYPTASCALSLSFDGDAISTLNAGVGCAALVPFALPDIERSVRGKRITPALIDEIGRYAAEISEPFDDNRGSAAYKRSLVATLLSRAFTIAEQRRSGRSSLATHTYYG